MKYFNRNNHVKYISSVILEAGLEPPFEEDGPYVLGMGGGRSLVPPSPSLGFILDQWSANGHEPASPSRRHLGSCVLCV